MENLLGYFKKIKSIAVVSGIVVVFFVGMLYFGRQSSIAPSVKSVKNDNSLQSMPQRNYPDIQQPGAGTALDFPGQFVAQNNITLPIGVTLGGKGTVLSVEPGSRAEAAGIQVGDIINRINGK